MFGLRDAFWELKQNVLAPRPSTTTECERIPTLSAQPATTEHKQQQHQEEDGKNK